YIAGHTALLGHIPSPYYIPSETVERSYSLQDSGVMSAAANWNQQVLFSRPFFFTGAAFLAGTKPSGGTTVCNLRRYDGSSFVDMLASDLSLSNTHRYVSSNVVDSVYRYRCIDSFHGASTDVSADIQIVPYGVSNAGSGADVTMWIRGIHFNRPQDALVFFNDPSKDGS
ncbi:hypothetical protein LCGC14_2627080, partial [marine sediment metagenome]